MADVITFEATGAKEWEGADVDVACEDFL